MSQREPAKVDPTDPAALEAWISDVGKLGAELLELAVDATAPKDHRKGSRTSDGSSCAGSDR